MILLIGSSGYIGSEFKRQLDLNNLKYKTLSYKDCQKDLISNIIKEYNIKYLINCAAFVGKPNIEACENQKDKCIKGNILLPILLKDICESFEITYCHISTGCLYSGLSEQNSGFSEEEEPNCKFENNNCSFYTGTKVLAEQIVKTYPKNYIWRIRLPFENIHNDRNYISKIIKYDYLIKENNSITNKKDFIKACIYSIINEAPNGIYNITNTGYISAYDIFEKLKKTIMQNKRATFLTMDEFYKKISSMPRSNCVLNNSKILSLGFKMPEVNESIDECLKEWRW